MSPLMDIAIIHSEFTLALNALQQNSTALNSADNDVEDIQCMAETLRRYRETLREIAGLMALYKNLLEKDQTAVASVQENMAEKDNLLQNKFRRPGSPLLSPVGGGGTFGVPR